MITVCPKSLIDVMSESFTRYYKMSLNLLSMSVLIRPMESQLIVYYECLENSVNAQIQSLRDLLHVGNGCP